MATTQDVTVVVVSRDRCDDLVRTLSRHEAPVVLVDNGSTDDTVATVRRRFPAVRVIRLPHNLGAVARNVGVVAAATPFVAFADDDSWWAPGALARAAAHLGAHPRLGLLAASVLVGPDEVLDPTCVAMRSAPLGTAGDLPGPDVLGFIACGAMVRRDAFLAVGGFDEVVFFPGEEARVAMDLVQAGWGLSFVEDVVVHHHPSPRRHEPPHRRRLVQRNAVLTAVMRRPWRSAGRVVAAGLRGDADERAGVLLAVPRVPLALRHRRAVSAGVELRLRRLEQVAAGQATG
jgi:GT2 family glycosyltransferase